MKIKIIDSIMGSGKTSAAINYMNKDYQKKFIYITPYLDEVDRVISACNEERDFGLCNYMDDKGICLKVQRNVLSNHLLRKKNVLLLHILCLISSMMR